MARLRANGMRFGLILCIGATAALFATGIAMAASQTIVGTGGNVFSPTSYTTDQGEVVPFNVTGGTHNVTANQSGPDGNALFRSNTISGGTTPVNGTQYLTTGSYPFICTIHPTTMQATLIVSANGTPQPRPGLQLKLVSKKVSKVSKKGTLLVQVTPTTKVDDVTIEAKLGKTTLGKSTGLSLAAGAQNVKLKLGKKAKSKLANKAKATIALSGSVPFGFPASAKGKLR